jgi:hypothetical protein
LDGDHDQRQRDGDDDQKVPDLEHRFLRVANRAGTGHELGRSTKERVRSGCNDAPLSPCLTTLPE